MQQTLTGETLQKTTIHVSFRIVKKLYSKHNERFIYEIEIQNQHYIMKVYDRGYGKENAELMITEHISIVASRKKLGNFCNGFCCLNLLSTSLHPFSSYPFDYSVIIMELLTPLDKNNYRLLWNDYSVREMIRGLATLHLENILHCDIKVENFLIRKFNNVLTPSEPLCMPVCIDFGISEVGKEIRIHDYLLATLITRPPELLFAKINALTIYDQRSEAFSFAMTLFDLFGFEEEMRNEDTSLVWKQVMGEFRTLRQNILSLPDDSHIKLQTLYTEKVEHIVYHTKKLVCTLGLPENDSPIFATPLGKILKKYRVALREQASYLSWKRTDLYLLHLPPIVKHIFEKCLQWDQSKRPTMIELARTFSIL